MILLIVSDRKIALLFPGQGSQFVGMGKTLINSFPIAQDVFAQVDSALGYKLSDTIFNGPEDALNSTVNTQPAIMAASIAAFRVLDQMYAQRFGVKNSGISADGIKTIPSIASKFTIAAGHSLGEYSAHAAVGTFSLSDTAKLLRARGSAMQDAVPVGKGGMVALVGCTIDQAEKICVSASEYGLSQVANDNGAGQIVVSGAIESMQYIVENHKDFGIRRAIMLSVSAPFHSALMQPAAAVMDQKLRDVEIHKPLVPVLANVSVQKVVKPTEIISGLVFQIAGKVRWRESLEYMIKMGIDTFVEVGPGKVLTGILGRIDKSLKTYNIMEPESFGLFLDECFE